MGLQSTIAASHSQLKRNLRDYSVFTSGDDIKVIRLTTIINKYKDITSITIDSHSEIILSLDMPADIPLSRLRTNISTPITTTENTFLYDILPIKGYARFEDNVEKGDFLIHKVYDEDDEVNGTNYLWVLEVTEILGNYSHGRLSGRHFYCSPYTMAMPDEVQTIIDNYNT